MEKKRLKDATEEVKSRRRRPGRPKQQLGLDVRILDAAERVFADRGFSSATLRMVAEASGANQALIRYYFGSKEDLFDRVFKRRAIAICERRIALLDDLEARAEGPSVRELIEAYLRPQWDMKSSGPNGAAFVRLQARLHADPVERAFRLRRDVYDPSVKRYIAALRRALPYLDPSEIAWRMAFLVGTYLHMLGGVDRLNDFSETELPREDPEVLLAHLVRFLEGGLKAPDMAG